MSAIFETAAFAEDFGTIRLEQWPEGLVLWVGGEIAWKSWLHTKQSVTLKLAIDSSEALAALSALQSDGEGE